MKSEVSEYSYSNIPTIEYLSKTGLEEGDQLDSKFITALSQTQFVLGGKIINFRHLNEKTLLIACFSLPMPCISRDAEHCRTIIDTYEDLCVTGDFEALIVVKSNPGATLSPYIYNRFINAFPCPVVSFYETIASNTPSDYLCSSIGMGQAVIISPNREILHYRHTLPFLRRYGSHWGPTCGFPPFRSSTLASIEEQDTALRRMLDPLYFYQGGALGRSTHRLSLHNILECDPNFDQLKRVGGGSACTADLSDSYVGLYLCADGSFMKQLKAVHDHCIRSNQQLEIILVCLPLVDDPSSFMADLEEGLRLCNITSWFVFQYHSKVCRKIWRLLGNSPGCPEDKLIIFPPCFTVNGELEDRQIIGGELDGREVMCKLGVNEYPFTRSFILIRRVESLRTLNPLSFFTGKNFKSTLRGKKLLLYLDWLDSPRFVDLYGLMISHYPQIKAMGWEVVFVSQGPKLTNPPVCSVELDDMPWPYMPPSNDATLLLDQLVFPEERVDCDFFKKIIAVSEDGAIRSMNVLNRLVAHGITGSLFDDRLFEEMAIQLSRFLCYYN